MRRSYKIDTKFESELEDFFKFKWNCLPKNILMPFKADLIEFLNKYHEENGWVKKNK